MNSSMVSDSNNESVILSDMLKVIWNEATRRKTSTENVNHKLFATSFFLLGMAVGDVSNQQCLDIAIDSLLTIEENEKSQRFSAQ